MEVKDRLKKIREEKDLSYSALAEKTGIPKSTLQRYETGYTKKIPIDNISILEKALGTPTGYLMGWEDEGAQQTEVVPPVKEEYQQLYEELDLEDKAEIRGTMKQMLKADKYKTDTSDTPSLSALRIINNRSDDGCSQAASNLKYKKKNK